MAGTKDRKMILMRRGRDGERGATLVEAALVYGLLFLSIFAVVEFGLAFKDWLSVSHASREAARAGATFGQDLTADIQVLDEVAATLEPIGLPEGTEVRIFKASSGGSVPKGTGTIYEYDIDYDCDAASGYSFSDCCDWDPCPEPGRPLYAPPVWDTGDRDIGAPDTDRIGVEVRFTHNWVTGFFAPTSDFTTVTEYQLEPQVFEFPETTTP